MFSGDGVGVVVGCLSGVDFMGETYGGDAAVGLDEFFFFFLSAFFGRAEEGVLDAGLGGS